MQVRNKLHQNIAVMKFYGDSVKRFCEGFRPSICVRDINELWCQFNFYWDSEMKFLIGCDIKLLAARYFILLQPSSSDHELGNLFS